MSVLSEIFGNCPQAKIIETFAENYNDKLYAADIVRMTDVAKATVHSHINKLLEEGLIEKKEKIGTIQFYQLNLDNPKAKIILMLESFIVSERLDKLVTEEPEKILEVEPLEQVHTTQSEYVSTNQGKSIYTYLNENFYHLIGQMEGYTSIASTEAGIYG